MKKVSVMQLAASVCLLIGCVVSLVNLCTNVPKAVEWCGIVLRAVSLVLYGILLVKMIWNKRKEKVE
ncbi:MAG: hypothetical protein IKL13_06115 [Clostridia bacterium]|nr:hypothetical protein [Clostridia bacterium]